MKHTTLIAILLVALLIGACASTPGTSPTFSSDPLEPVNRGIYAFNTGLDQVTFKPVAKGYRSAVPGLMRRGIRNLFTNLRAPLTIANQLLQGKGRAALSDTGRLLLNSTVGLGGLLDPATPVGLEQHQEDFGQTLAVWGVPDGPFVMVPLLGPRNLRDAVTIPLNFFARPLTHYENSSVRDKLLSIEVIAARAQLLFAEGFIKDSIDPYVTIRDAYQQNRRFKVHDGNPPEQDDDLFDEFLE